ncbi:MAG: YchJ family metal-binding protein [Actinomycetota bacterium]
MRSRYTAYVLGDVAHLRRSWHPETRPTDVTLVAGQRWTGLEILGTVGGQALDSNGEVEFVAHYQGPEAAGSLHEHSRFERVDGRWVYVDGDASGV